MSFRLLPPANRPTIDKDLDASLRYGIDVAGLLSPADSVTGVSIAAQSGITAANASATGSVVSCLVSGGTAGQVGSVTLRWTTAQGYTDERTLYFNVLER